ncbi:MAG: O-antigen ligase family protein [Gemmatimonadaceae bacterium]|nr:O-antigen ligase family protein [Gemmatimonadaceae bacterium]
MAFVIGFGPAIPDLVFANTGLGLQISILAMCAMGVLTFASRPMIPRRLFGDPLVWLALVFALSVIPLLGIRGIGADAPLLKWSRQLSTVLIMLGASIALSLACDSSVNVKRWLIAGVVSGGVFTLLTSCFFLLAHAFGAHLQLWHNNLSFVSAAGALPAVAVRDAESVLPRVYGFFTEPSFFSAFAAPTGAFMTALPIFRARPWSLNSLCACSAGVLLLLVAILVSSRTGTLTGIFALIAIALARRRSLRLLITTSFVATFVAPLTLAISPIFAADNLATVDVSVLERTAAAAIGLSEFRAHPVLGVGFGAFGFAYNDGGDLAVSDVEKLLTVVTEQQNASSTLPNAFNLVVRLAAETGIIGLATLALLVASLGRSAVRGTASTRAASVAAIAFLVASIDSFVMMQFWVFWALARASDSPGDD